MCETSRDDGQLHRLLLKNRDTQRAMQNRFDRLVRIDHRFFAIAPSQIGMHHVPLDRAGPHDGDFDYQIVPTARPQPRQHAHLTATFDLKDPNRVGIANHVIDSRIVLRDIRQRTIAAPMLLEHLKALADRR